MAQRDHHEKLTHLEMTLSRRNLLRVAGAAAVGSLLPEGVPRPAAARTDRPRAEVALAHADDYDLDVIRERVNAMIDGLGGLDDVVGSGDKVAIKTNLTGGTYWTRFFDRPLTEIYVTHPAVVQALGEAVLDAGASELYIVESIYDVESWTVWGHQAVADKLDATLINLNDAVPYNQYVDQPVGEDWLTYPQFTLNPILAEVDAFMSVGKLKCHASAGITLSMKNLVGMVPFKFYRLSDEDSIRTEFHGASRAYRYRLPSTIVDLVRARPIDFALIDGVMTAEGGEGPWLDSFNPLDDPLGVLIAGKNPVATDAVGAAVMGFDPTARSLEQVPFEYCLNHLQIADEYDLGPHDLAEIKIIGADLDELRVEFKPYQSDNPSAAVPPPHGMVGHI